MKALRHRPARVIPAVLVSIVLLALAAGLIWTAVQKLSTGHWWPWLPEAARVGEGLAWSDPAAIAAAIVLGLIGLILILWALTPGAFNTALITTPKPDPTVLRGDIHAVITTRGLATLASGAVSQIDGVSSVSSSATSKTVLVNLKTPLRSTQSLVTEAQAAVEQRMHNAGVSPVPKIRIRAQTKEMS